jgi:hypothetical protein
VKTKTDRAEISSLRGLCLSENRNSGGREEGEGRREKGEGRREEGEVKSEKLFRRFMC